MKKPVSKKTVTRASAVARKATAKKSTRKTASKKPARKAANPGQVKAKAKAPAKARKVDPVKAAEKAIAAIEREMGVLVNKLRAAKARHDKAHDRLDALKAKAAAKTAKAAAPKSSAPKLRVVKAA